MAFGFNIGTTYEIPDGDLKYAFNLYAKFNLDTRFNLNIGLSYDFLQDHTNLTLDYYSTVLHRRIERQYFFLNIPALFCFQFGKGRMQSFLGAGLQFSILVKNEFSSEDEIFSTKERLINNGSFSAFGALGLGFIYKIKPKLGLTFHLNYYSSFIPLVWQSTNQIGEPIYEKININYFKGCIGILYHLKK